MGDEVIEWVVALVFLLFSLFFLLVFFMTLSSGPLSRPLIKVMHYLTYYVFGAINKWISTALFVPSCLRGKKNRR